MSKLINKNGECQDNTWVLVEKDATADFSTAAPLLIHATAAQEVVAGQHWGVWLDSNDSISSLPSNLKGIPVIAINFPIFADGRGFSLARQIREQLDYTGELRAIGNFMLDQVLYLKRCGIDTFVLHDEVDVATFTTLVNAFRDSYQAAADEPRPLFRRRA